MDNSKDQSLNNVTINAFNAIANRVNPLALLAIPEIRQIVNESLLEKINSEELQSNVHSDNDYSVRPGTYEHNKISLNGGLRSFDRGSILTNIAWACIPTSLQKHIQVLHIGPKNLNELLLSYSLSRASDKVHAVDLIPSLPFVNHGDMHRLEYADNKFDLIIAGWVLPYSTDPLKAVREILRVSKTNSVLAFGWDLDVSTTMLSGANHLLSNMDDVFHYGNCESVLNLLHQAGAKISDVYVSIDPKDPYCHDTKRALLVCSVSKCKMSPFTWDFLLEAESVHKVITHLTPKDYKLGTNEHVDNILYRLKQHYNQAVECFSESSHDQSSYLIMRRQSCDPHNTTDELLHTALKDSFPWNVNRFIQESYPHFQPLFSVDRSRFVSATQHLRSKGYYIFPEVLPRLIIEKLDQCLKESQDSSHSGRKIVTDAVMASHYAQDIAFSHELICIAGEWLECFPIFDGIIGMVTNQTIEPNETALHSKISGDAQLLHHDKDRIKWLKFFIYLTDVLSEAEGAHVIYSSTNKSGAPRDNRILESDIESFYGQGSTSNKHLILGQAGTIFAVDTSNLHRGSRVEHGQRRVLEVSYCTSQFGAKYSPFDINKLKPKYLQGRAKFPRLFSRYT
jgi:hypothetical protein